MYNLICCVVLAISCMTFSHDKDMSRAEFFKEELRLNEKQLITINGIDNRYRIKYQKLNSEIQFRNTELKEVIYETPFSEQKVKGILSKISEAESLIKLNNIKHHFEIEDHLDSYQRMKFNERFSP